jgi:hypothetical protein
MLDELQKILGREHITTAAIIDDVFDETPLSRDIDNESWNVFLDDQSEREVAIIREHYGLTDPESRWEELRNDDNFIRCLWDHRAESEVFQSLFRSFVDRQTAGKAQLEPLRVLLFDELKLQGGTYGSHQLTAAEGAQLLFVDLFLGAHQDEEARNKALIRVKAIVDPRRESPPMIVLMSSSTRLQAMREEFRDEAGLVGCQFRTVGKLELTEVAELHELLFRLTSSYQDSLKLSQFLELWRQSLQDATTRFLKAARRLDLRDYADLETLILNAEGERIGAYLLEVFGQYFQFELEEDGRLSSAALKLNEVEWKNYPAPHFLPAAISANIADGLLFRSAKILSKTEPLQFGDVLFSTRVDALGEGAEPAADFAKGERIALLVLTAACDLQHGYAKRFLFLAGLAKPSELIFHKKPNALLTPVLIHDAKHYVLEWDLGAPVAWTPTELTKQLESGAFQRVRRFRSLFSLQLQQLFTSSLSRVGTPVMPPVQHLTGATISYVDIDGNLRQLVKFAPADQKAVVLVGRTEREHVDRLMLAPEVVSELRVEMQKLDPARLSAGNREKWRLAIQNRELFSKMEEGIPYERNGLARSFKGSHYDVVTVIGPYSDQNRSPITAERKLKGDHGPVIVELEIPDPL